MENGRPVGQSPCFLVLTLLVVAFSAVMSRLNYFEWMFHPIEGPQFLAQSASKLDPKEMILAVRFGDDDRAYPISQMAYHHVLNDVVGWRSHRRHLLNALSHRSGVDANRERQSTAFLSGRHQQPELPHARQGNRNLVAADHRQGHLRPAARRSAGIGPQRRTNLRPVENESPAGRVLAPVAKYTKEYDTNWEPDVAKLPVVISFPGTELKSRDVVIGLTINSAARAYPWESFAKQSPVVDRVNGTPLLVVLGPDGKSFRVFVSRIDGQDAEFFLQAETARE